MNGVPAIDLEPHVQAFRSVQNPQQITPQQLGADINGFWETIYALLLEGKLSDAWEILSLHREISAVIMSDDNDRNNNTPNRNSSSNDDKKTLKSIYDVLNSHPFINLVDAVSTYNDENVQALNIPSSITLDFKDWQDKIKEILENQSPILGRIKELNNILLILLGDKDTLVQFSLGEWTTLGVGLFLYVYPPPLIRSNITKIVESVMTISISRNDITPDEILK